MSTETTIDSLGHEEAREAFFDRYSTAHPQVKGEAIDLAFREALHVIAPSESLYALEAEMDRRLGFTSDEEE